MTRPVPFAPTLGRPRAGVPAMVLVAGLSLPAAASGISADYAISLAGLPLGTARMTATVEGEAYKLGLDARLTGLAGILTSGKGGATASGALGPNRPVPAAFSILTRSSSAGVAIRLALAKGNVTSVEIEPAAEPKPDRVPLAGAHTRGVVDPASALLMPVGTSGEPMNPAHCERTIPVFDGWTRFDVVLSYAETRQADQAGYKGPVLVCNARYVPVAGHRAERPGVRFMAQNRDMSVWLAPVPGARALAPFRISVRTTLGTSVIEATKWSAEAGAAPVAASGASGRAR